MTYRERRARRAERLREWAEKRAVRAEAAFERADTIADGIPMGQPILVGHHSEGHHRRDMDRIDRSMHTGIENIRMADRMQEKARNIEAAVAVAIYTDDPDAYERIQDKITTLEAERDAIKTYNKSCRSDARDESLLTPKQREDLRVVARVAAYQLGKKGEMPGYALTNLSGNISRLKKRLAELQEGTDR